MKNIGPNNIAILDAAPAQRFQDLPATPRSAQEALALLAQIEHISKNGPQLATPGNPNPEKQAEEIGGIVATFLYNNARTLLESYMVLQTEYFPAVQGLSGMLRRGGFAQHIASAVVQGFSAVANENKKVDGISDDKS